MLPLFPAAVAGQHPSPTIGAAAAEPVAVEPALMPFQAAVERYLDLRIGLRQELPPMVLTSRAADISEVSDALAAAIQRARRGARQGAFFTPAVARVMRERLQQTVPDAEVARLIEISDDDPPVFVKPGIHVRFPGPAMLATMPADVLHTLPRLPPELEYRFVGNVLVLRDIEAALILDYMAPALRRR